MIVLTFVVLTFDLFRIADSQIFESVFCKADFSYTETDYLHCAVNLTYLLTDSANSKCRNVSSNSFIVETTPHVQELSFICQSNNPIYVDVDFEYGVPLKSLSKIQWTRVLDRYDDLSSYSYQVNISPPLYTLNSIGVTSVKYKLFNFNSPDDQVTVLWHFSPVYAKTEAVYVRWLGDVNVNNQGLNQLTIDKEIILIPCVSPFGKVSLRLGTEPPIPIDNITLSYDPMVGLLFNPTAYIGRTEEYSCGSVPEEPPVVGDPPYVEYFQNFELVARNGFKASSKISEMRNTAENYLKTPFVHSVANYYQEVIDHKEHIWDFDNTQFDLECIETRFNFNVSIMKVIGNQLEELDFNHTIEDFPVRTSIARYTTPVNSSGAANYVCVGLEIVMFQWLINWQNLGDGSSRLIELVYDENYDDIRCSSYETIPGLLPVTIDIKHIPCADLFTCRLLAKCLLDPEYGTGSVNCEQQGYAVGEPCENSIEYDPGNFNETARCNSVRPFSKGLVQCKRYDRVIQEVYFTGFDGKIYLGAQEFTAENVNAVLKIDSPATEIESWVAIPGNFSFHCEGHSFHFENGMRWFFEYANGTLIQIPKDNITETSNRSYVANPISYVDIHFGDIEVKKVICSAPMLSIKNEMAGSLWLNTSIGVSLKYSISPDFTPDQRTEYEIDIEIGNQELKCECHGFPVPKINWTRENQTYLSTKEDITHKSDGDYSVLSYLVFPVFNEKDSGTFVCTAFNEAGHKSMEIEAFVTKKHKEDDGDIGDSRTWWPVTVAAATLVVLIPIGFLLVVVNERRREIKAIKDLINGTNTTVRSENSPVDNPLQLPYDRSLELNKNSFSIDKTNCIGRGEFGEVFTGRLSHVDNCVAFKTINSQNSHDTTYYLKALASELKILSYIGKHENVVQLLGAYTSEIDKGVLLLAIEFCGLGSMESYLRANKGRFKQCPILTSADLRSTTGYVVTNRFVNVPFQNSMKCLLKWCTEIANAMEHLSYKKVVHSDLATRNVLLTVDFVAKITDFGLSRRMYAYTEYRKTGKDPLPWRWLAVESLKSLVFTTNSDVWSYGIVLWEIFTLGEVPYPGIIDQELDFVSRLENGLRNLKPKYANRQLYHIMLKCWNLHPDNRPSFGSLKTLFNNALLSENYTLELQIPAYQPAQIMTEDTFHQIRESAPPGYMYLH